MPQDDGRDPDLPQTTPITITPVVAADVATLADFSAFVARELDQNLRPATDAIAQDHIQGATWAANLPGLPIFRARADYQFAQHSSLTALDQYIVSSELLIAVIKRIMDRYALANGQNPSLQDVANIFSEVAPMYRTEEQKETDRENRRGGR